MFYSNGNFIFLIEEFQNLNMFESHEFESSSRCNIQGEHYQLLLNVGNASTLFSGIIDTDMVLQRLRRGVS